MLTDDDLADVEVLAYHPAPPPALMQLRLRDCLYELRRNRAAAGLTCDDLAARLEQLLTVSDGWYTLERHQRDDDPSVWELSVHQPDGWDRATHTRTSRTRVYPAVSMLEALYHAVVHLSVPDDPSGIGDPR